MAVRVTGISIFNITKIEFLKVAASDTIRLTDKEGVQTDIACWGTDNGKPVGYNPIQFDIGSFYKLMSENQVKGE